MDRSELIKLIRKLSYREGDFTLASGKKSKFYIDLKVTTLHPQGAALIGKLAIDLIREKKLGVKGVGGLTLGADPLVTAVGIAGLEQGLILPALIVRKEAKDHGTSKYIEGVENVWAPGPVLVLEDVTTTGGSALTAVERLREMGYQIAGVLTVVDREQGGAEKFAALGIPFFKLLTLSEVQSSSTR